MTYLFILLHFSINILSVSAGQDSVYDARVYLNKGIRYQNNGEFVKALEVYERSYNLDPNYTPAVDKITDVLLLYGKRDSLISQYSNKVMEEPDNPIHHYIYGKLERDASIKKAEFLKCMELDSLYYWGYIGLASYYYETGKRDSSMLYYRKAIRINPAIIDGHYNLGKLYYERENYEKAEEEFEKCIKINPRIIMDIYYKLALLYEFREETPRAIEYYKLLLRYAPDAPEVDHIINVLEFLNFKIDEENKDNVLYRLKKRLGEVIK